MVLSFFSKSFYLLYPLQSFIKGELNEHYLLK